MNRWSMYLLLLTLPVSAIASDSDDNTPLSQRWHGCKNFHAHVVDTKTTEGCTSPLGACSAGTIEGNRGMNGTIYSTIDSAAMGPATTPEPSKTVSFSQISVFTLANGTLTARETGISSVSAVEPARRFFSGFAEFTGGTGRYAGATGHLYFSGKKIGDYTITDVMIGEICLP